MYVCMYVCVCIAWMLKDSRLKKHCPHHHGSEMYDDPSA
jgi:hypothetical protein